MADCWDHQSGKLTARTEEGLPFAANFPAARPTRRRFSRPERRWTRWRTSGERRAVARRRLAVERRDQGQQNAIREVQGALDAVRRPREKAQRVAQEHVAEQAGEEVPASTQETRAVDSGEDVAWRSASMVS